MLTADDMCTQEPSTTSAGGAMRAVRPVKYHVIALGPPFDFGTAVRVMDVDLWEQFEVESQYTTSGCTIERKQDPQDTGSATVTLRRLTGFTWDQIARLFSVARRSLHFWASGKPLNAANEEQLYRTLAVVRTIDRGTASENRTLLLQERQGLIPFDLLADRRYDDVVTLVGAGPGRGHRGIPSLSPEAQAARAPLPPEVLADALQDTVHRDVGRGRAARTMKAKRRGHE
jgi:hypothetical protein